MENMEVCSSLRMEAVSGGYVRLRILVLDPAHETPRLATGLATLDEAEGLVAREIGDPLQSVSGSLMVRREEIPAEVRARGTKYPDSLRFDVSALCAETLKFGAFQRAPVRALEAAKSLALASASDEDDED